MKSDELAEVIGKMAHDLRAPLTSVKGFSSTLLKRWERFSDEQKRELVEAIHADAGRLERTIATSVDRARLSAGRLELSYSEVDLAEVSRKVVEAAAARHDPGRLRVQVPEGLTAWADETRLTHALIELVDNALAFSDGSVDLTAVSRGSEVELSVADSGPGVPKQTLDSARSKVASGLYLASGIAGAHGAALRFADAGEGGSSVTVSLAAQRAS